MYQTLKKKNRLNNSAGIVQQEGRHITDCRSSNILVQNMIESIHSSTKGLHIIQGVFKKEDGTATTLPHPRYEELSKMEKGIFDILRAKEVEITLEDTASLEDLKEILITHITDITDKDFIRNQGYVFTHETSLDSFSGISGSKALLGRAATSGADRRSRSDATRTRVTNPVFTRLTSAKTIRVAHSGSTGSDRPILIVISPLAAVRDNPLVPGSHLVGCYNEDVGKTGSRRNAMEPKTLADSSPQSSSNEQHWKEGIDLKQNAIGIAIKVKGRKCKGGLTLYKGNTSDNFLINTDVINKEDLLRFGDESVKQAVGKARAISDTLLIKGININYPLSNLHVLFST